MNLETMLALLDSSIIVSLLLGMRGASILDSSEFR